MAVMTASQCVRNSAVLVHQFTSEDTAIGIDSTSMPFFRAIGGSTLVLVGDASTPLTYKFDDDERIAFLVAWGSSAGTTGAQQLQVTQGTQGKGAWRRSQGNYTLTLQPSSSAGQVNKWIIGPFESARFAQNATSTAVGVKLGQNYISMKFATTVGMTTFQNAHVQVKPFRMPAPSYST